ncbi:hypothetical protein [Flavobacterium sp. HSC-61S13]|uniref:hypothetical protein n=1 Tax=Flavobacterium sp. HSC-61S13 TaxID=2910963 RepID=UPI00209D4C84|nr:hypothetical protein [Flavobacterium sp. HSC-61S13]MCP1997333.1 hypothetical protein [Flavobacterium sp. HSC-61S13]
MKTMFWSSFFMLTVTTSCAQENNEAVVKIPTDMKTINTVPFLTEQGDFIYVDKAHLKPISAARYKMASVFTVTGFAVVENASDRYAVIDQLGKTVLDFSTGEIDLNVVNGITFYKREREYQKKMPFWRWEWNILGGGIQKEQTYHSIEIGVLESKQTLVNQEIPYLEDSYYLNFIAVDRQRVFWNASLYEINNKRLKKVAHHIVEVLEDQRFVKMDKTGFSIYNTNSKKPIHKALLGTETLTIEFGKEEISLNDINKERFAPELPKLLVDSDKGDVYVFPQYDKVFPREIKSATAAQIDFLKKTSLIYSIADSPYFLLGIFNYDHDVWAYDWLYIDTDGNLIDRVDTYNFKVLDQLGNMVWPDRKMIIPDEFVGEGWKFGKVNTYREMDGWYLIRIENGKQQRSIGLWNSNQMIWELPPVYRDISVLDAKKQIYALQNTAENTYILYDHKDKKRIGFQAYSSINSDGLVRLVEDSGDILYFYIDIYSGREYREHKNL